MKVYINNEEKETGAQDLSALAQEMALPERGVAIAVAERIVPRTQWAETTLDEGDRITVIKAVFGG